jgi:hypothetical protein
MTPTTRNEVFAVETQDPANGTTEGHSGTVPTHGFAESEGLNPATHRFTEEFSRTLADL